MEVFLIILKTVHLYLIPNYSKCNTGTLLNYANLIITPNGKLCLTQNLLTQAYSMYSHFFSTYGMMLETQNLITLIP